MGLMTTIAILGQTTNDFMNDKYSLHLGGMTHLVTHNNPMPEVGVALGHHRTEHNIYKLDCGGVEINIPEFDENGEPKPIDIPSVNVNESIGSPELIYSYNGFASSPHKVSFLKNGLVLIPTDIGILQYDLLNKQVICEWLNPTLIPFVYDHIKVSGDKDVTCVVEGNMATSLSSLGNNKKYVAINIHTELSRNDTEYNVGAGALLSVSAEAVYNNTSNIGSYGQITYEGGDYSSDLIVLLKR
jgi:hypothetical protein